FFSLKNQESLKQELRSLWKHRPMRLYLWGVVVWSITVFISLFWREIHPLSYLPGEVHETGWNGLFKLWMFLLPPAWFITLKKLTSSQREKLFFVFWVSFAFFAVIGLAQYFTGWPRPRLIPGSNPER